MDPAISATNPPIAYIHRAPSVPAHVQRCLGTIVAIVPARSCLASAGVYVDLRERPPRDLLHGQSQRHRQASAMMMSAPGRTHSGSRCRRWPPWRESPRRRPRARDRSAFGTCHDRRGGEHPDIPPLVIVSSTRTTSRACCGRSVSFLLKTRHHYLNQRVRCIGRIRPHAWCFGRVRGQHARRRAPAKRLPVTLEAIPSE
jgi:hypothetical protein